VKVWVTRFTRSTKKSCEMGANPWVNTRRKVKIICRRGLKFFPKSQKKFKTVIPDGGTERGRKKNLITNDTILKGNYQIPADCAGEQSDGEEQEKFQGERAKHKS